MSLAVFYFITAGEERKKTPILCCNFFRLLHHNILFIIIKLVYIHQMYVCSVLTHNWIIIINIMLLPD